MSASICDTISPQMMSRIQALRLMDDDFMTVVFDGDTELTEFLLKVLLSRDDLSVKSVMAQKEKRNLFGRSVRLDIIAEDIAGKTYNIEVQRADKGASPKRVRYNLALLDSHQLKKNDDFEALPETFIIFITENDFYELGRPFYQIRKIVDGTDLPFEDACTIIYVNGVYRGNDAIGKLMHDFCTPNADEMNYANIADKVRLHKQESKGVKTMCKIFEEYGDERVAEKTVEIVEKLLSQNKLTVEEIAVATTIPLEQVQKIAEKLKMPELA